MLKRVMTGLAMMAASVFAPQGFEAAAQSRWQPGIAFGVRAGADMSRVSFSPSIHQSMSPGATAGVTFRYAEEYHFGIIAELDWTQRGWKEDFKEHTAFKYRRVLNYIELPVMAHIYFGRTNRFFFNAGPVVSYLLGEKTLANFDYEHYASVEGYPKTGRTNTQLNMAAEKRFDYGICAGIGGELWVGRHNSLYLEGRFYYGLANIFSSKRADPFHNSNSMVASVVVGYWFNLR